MPVDVLVFPRQKVKPTSMTPAKISIIQLHKWVKVWSYFSAKFGISPKQSIII